MRSIRHNFPIHYKIKACHFIITLMIILGVSSFPNRVFSDDDLMGGAKNPKESSSDGVNVVVRDWDGTIMKRITTKEELEDWSIEVECKNRQSQFMLVGMPRDKAEVFRQRLTENQALKMAECMGNEFQKRGKFDKATEQFKRSIALSKNVFDAWHSRYALANIYEKTSQYNVAIEELNWLIANANEPAKKELLERKAHLEVLLKQSST